MVVVLLLNTEQRLIFSTLNHAVNADNGSLFFINGPNNIRKTFLQNTVFAH